MRQRNRPPAPASVRARTIVPARTNTVARVPSESVMVIGILSWVVVGVVVGFIVSKAVNLRGDDPRLGIAGAVAGSIVAALVYTFVADQTIRPWNTWALVWATIGAIVGAAAWHAIRSRSISHEQGTVRYGHR